MSMFYYLDQNGQQAGPVAAESLPSFGVKAETLVWTEGMPGWAAANSVAELAPFFTAAQGISNEETVMAPQQHVQEQPQYQPQQAAQTQYQPQQAAQPQYQQQAGYQQPQQPMPNSNLPLAIFTTLCCCLPLGIVGIIKASKVSNLYAMGQYQAAQEAANEAKKWSMIGLGVGLAVQVIYVIFYVIVMANAF